MYVCLVLFIKGHSVMANKTGLQFTATVEGLPEDTFVVTQFSGNERLSTIYSFSIELASRNPDFLPPEMVDKNVSLYLWKNGELTQQWSGIIRRFIKKNTGHFHSFFQMDMVPALARLSLRTNCRIFQQHNVQMIIEQLLQEMEILDVAWNLSLPHPNREYCVQYGESDLDFLQRLIAEEGICYYFEQQSKKQVVVFTDNTANNPKLPCAIKFNSMASTQSSEPFISQLNVASELMFSSVQLKDYSFKKPTYSFQKTARASNNHLSPHYECFDFPGRYKDGDIGHTYSQHRIEAEHAHHNVTSGTGDHPLLSAGYQFTLIEHIEALFNDTWLVVGVKHEGTQPQALEEMGGDGITSYHNSFDCIPASQPWRERITKPIMSGPQMATVVGPPGEEIYCDEFGRVKVQFPWDRYNQNNDQSSCWIRVSSYQFGSVALPRIGHEVIVDFLDGDPDQPIIIGRTHHIANALPYSLPGAKTRTVIRSNTHKGTGHNEITFEDQSGQEQMYLHAQKDQEVVINNDKRQTIKRDATHSIGQNLTHTIGQDHTQNIGQNANITIGANQTVAIGANRTIAVEQSETHAIKQQHTLTIDDKQIVSVGSDQITTVKGNQTETILKDQIIVVEKSQSQTINESSTHYTMKSANYISDKEIVLQCGSSTIYIAPTGITLSYGETTYITIDDQGISQNGSKIRLN